VPKIEVENENYENIVICHKKSRKTKIMF